MKNTERALRRRELADAVADSVYAIRAAEVAQLGLICDLIDAYDAVPVLPGPGTPRLVRSGGDGTPKVDEFLINELHPLLGVGPVTAWALLRDAINLRDRHRHTWELTQTLDVPVWQARKVAQACADLTAESAAWVDTKIAPSLATNSWSRVKKRLDGLVACADTELAARKTATAREDRFVSIKHVGDGTSWLVAHVATPDAVLLQHAIDVIARDISTAPGYTGTVGHARADAFGILAAPTSGRGSSGERGPSGGLPRPEATLVIHLDRTALGQPADTTTGRGPGGRASDQVGQSEGAAGTNSGRPTVDGRAGSVRDADRSSPTVDSNRTIDPTKDQHGIVGRAEGPHGLDDIGPLLLAQVRELLAHRRVRVLPVLDLAGEAGVDSYEIPDRLRTHIVLRDSYSVFPYSNRRARDCDLDHTTPWQPGVPNQTRPGNLGALDRRSHRAKTHTGWEVRQLAPGVFDWTSPLGYHYTVTRDGTHRDVKAPPWAVTGR